MYKLFTSSGGSDDLSIGFDRDCAGRQQELNNNKSIKGNFHDTNLLKDVSGFAGHQEKIFYGLGYKLTSTRKKDAAVLSKGETTAIARSDIDLVHWYVLQYTPSIP